MKKCRKCIIYRILIIAFACILFLPNFINRIQYEVRSPEDGLPTRNTVWGYPCTYYWLNIDDAGSVYARTTFALVKINGNKVDKIYHLDAFPRNSCVNISSQKIQVYDLDNMIEYEYYNDGTFIGKREIEDPKESPGYNEVTSGEITYRVEYTSHFSLVTASSMQDDVERTEIILRALSKRDRAVISCAVLAAQIVIFVLYLYHASRHRQEMGAN